MKKARDVLNELKWREGHGLERATVWVRGRTAKEVKAIDGGAIVELGGRYFSTAEATIPYYKVVQIDHEGRTVFEREDATAKD